jgi:limonene-1,2-epoxide hydrolase
MSGGPSSGPTNTIHRSAAMSTQDIANRLAELCREGKFEAAQKELFAEDAVSIEPFPTEAFAKETRGLRAIIDKGHKFETMVEKIHGCSTSPPLVAGNAITFALTLDATMKGRGRVKMEEICVYEVKDGKITSEQFFM